MIAGAEAFVTPPSISSNMLALDASPFGPRFKEDICGIHRKLFERVRVFLDLEFFFSVLVQVISSSSLAESMMMLLR